MKKFCIIALALCAILGMAACADTPAESRPADSSAATATTAQKTTTTEYDPVTDPMLNEQPLILRLTGAELKTYSDPYVGLRYYYLILPRDYDASKQYPTMLYLHGAGERGMATLKPLQNMFFTLFADMEDYFRDTIVVVPQCPTWGWWSLNTDGSGVHRGELGFAMRLLEDTCADYAADRDRLYAMGLSMGGAGTWEALSFFPDTFAAGVPICGWGDPNFAHVLADIPIWAYHGKEDPTVSYQSSEQMVNAIRAAGGQKIHFTLHETAGHAVWQQTAKDRAVFDWLFSQKKG